MKFLQSGYHILPFIILVNNNYFFISANIIGMFISYFLELSTRKEFYMRMLLEQEKENVKTANNALEKRVEERTQQLSDANQDLKKEIEIRQKFERERAELEKQLFQLQKMETIGTLAGGIAHDFNNILTPILGYTDMALEELPEESNLRFDIEQINNAAHRGKDLVQQVLTFSREVDFENKPIQLQPIVTEALNLIKASFSPWSCNKSTIRSEDRYCFGRSYSYTSDSDESVHKCQSCHDENRRYS